ncbi:MAG: hypothetical protein QOF25_5727 [Mycobacterium sp.]|nr:hypothetical protein [Mycobacterium sp.]
MNLRSARGSFLVFCGIQAIGEFISATYIEVWMYALAFGALFLVAAALVHRGRVIAGVSIASVISLFELVNYPFWLKTDAWDWIFDSLLAAAAAATLVAVVRLLADRRRAVVVD